VKALDSIATDVHGDREVRKQAVFALSQRSANQGVPALIRIARTSSDPELRRTAIFWLGQSDDPRAIDLFEEILR
jgi:HEAT repeat protein